MATTRFIMVLSDGETYSELPGCQIVEVPHGSDAEEIEAQVRSHDIVVVRRFGVTPAESDFSS